MSKLKMKAIVAQGYGTPAVLEFKEIDKPEPEENEVLVKIYSTTVTQADAMMRTGKPYFARLFTGILKPKHPVPGTGFAGIVEQVGSKVSNFKIGNQVFGETTLGFSTNAEYVAIPENGVIIKKPENLSFSEAATFTDGHLTSFNLLNEIVKIRPGQKVLVNGASGSLGTAAIQLAKYFGAEVTGVCSSKNVGLVKSLGADFVIDYKEEDFTQKNEKYDVVYDTVGKSSFGKSRKVLKKNGVYISPVMKFSLLLQMLLFTKFSKKNAMFAATGLKRDVELRKMLGQLLEIYKEGRLKAIIDRQYPLEKVAEAHAYVDGGHKRGNVVINVQF